MWGGRSEGLKGKWVLQVTAMALRERVPEQLAGLLTASHPELRAAAVFTLGTLVQVQLFQINAMDPMCVCCFQPVQLCRVTLESHCHENNLYNVNPPGRSGGKSSSSCSFLICIMLPTRTYSAFPPCFLSAASMFVPDDIATCNHTLCSEVFSHICVDANGVTAHTAPARCCTAHAHSCRNAQQCCETNTTLVGAC